MLFRPLQYRPTYEDLYRCSFAGAGERTRRDAMHVQMLAVHPEFQRRGFGRQMLALVCKQVRFGRPAYTFSRCSICAFASSLPPRSHSTIQQADASGKRAVVDVKSPYLVRTFSPAPPHRLEADVTSSLPNFIPTCFALLPRPLITKSQHIPIWTLPTTATPTGGALARSHGSASPASGTGRSRTSARATRPASPSGACRASPRANADPPSSSTGARRATPAAAPRGGVRAGVRGGLEAVPPRPRGLPARGRGRGRARTRAARTATATDAAGAGGPGATGSRVAGRRRTRIRIQLPLRGGDDYNQDCGDDCRWGDAYCCRCCCCCCCC